MISNRKSYQWHFSSTVRMGKRAMVAILTQDDNAVYVYGICPKSLKGEDYYIGLDTLVDIAKKYSDQNRITNLKPPTWSPLEIIPNLKNPIDVAGKDGKAKRLRYGVLFNISKTMPLSLQSENVVISENVKHDIFRFTEITLASKANINRPIKVGKQEQNFAKTLDNKEKKKKQILELQERIRKGEAMQRDWIAEHGGENTTYKSFLYKLRFELNKLSPSSSLFEFTAEDDYKYAWAWDLIEKGPQMEPWEWRKLGRAMKNDPRLDAWICEHPRESKRVTIDDIVKLFGGKEIEKKEVEIHAVV